MRDRYHDIDDFLATEHDVPSSFFRGAHALSEAFGSRAREDVGEDFQCALPLWMYDGEELNSLIDIEHLPECFDASVFAKIRSENGARITNLRSVNESFFGFGARLAEALEAQAQALEEGHKQAVMEKAEDLRNDIVDAYERRWRDVLFEACGRSSEIQKLERLLTREERKVWDAGRAAQASYENWKNGRGARVEAAKIVLDAKKKQRLG